MPPLIDRAGRRYGRLVVEGRHEIHPKGPRVLWRCRCDCGNTLLVRSYHLDSGAVSSCGCYRREWARLKATKHGEAGRWKRENEFRSKEYKTWLDMKKRCLNKTSTHYRHYGGRGITIFQPWVSSFERFVMDVGRAPSDTHEFDRIDNNGNYEPGNVRWATRTEQMRNMRRNRVITFRGESLTISGWTERLGLGYSIIGCRLRRGWSIERALTTPLMKRGQE